MRVLIFLNAPERQQQLTVTSSLWSYEVVCCLCVHIMRFPASSSPGGRACLTPH